jgi:hypothetical protein
MGSGTFDGTKFHLSVTFTYDASDPHLLRWRTAFEHASRLLFDATDGQMQFGTIQYGINNTGISHADSHLEPGTTGTSGTTGDISQAGSYCTLFYDETLRPHVIVHEFGHYGLFLGDEYWYIGNDVWDRCTADVHTEGACYMGFGWKNGLQLNPDGTIKVVGIVSEFCCETNHDTHAANMQQFMHGQSCWNTIAEKYSGITAPGVGQRPASTPPTEGPDPLVWEPIDSLSRIVFVVDLLPENAALLENVQLVRELTRQLPATDVPEWITPHGSSIDDSVSTLDELKTQSVRDITGTLIQLVRFFSQRNPSGRHSVVWLSDGFEASSSDMAIMGRSFARQRIDFHGVTFAGSTGVSPLHTLSSLTRGSLRITSHLDAAHVNTSLTADLLSSALDSAEHFGILNRQAYLLGTNKCETEVMAVDDVQIVPHSNITDQGTTIEWPVWVEQGAETAVFALACSPDSQLAFKLLSPDGLLFDQSAREDCAVIGNQSDTLRAVIVNLPQTGSWAITVSRKRSAGSSYIELLAAARHRQILMNWDVTPLDGLRFRIEVSVSFGLPLLYLEPAVLDVQVLQPDGTWRRVQTAPLLPGTDSDSSTRHRLIHEVTFPEPGTYRLGTRITNLGNARPVTWREVDSPDSVSQQAANIPAFSRLLHRMVHVQTEQPQD